MSKTLKITDKIKTDICRELKQILKHYFEFYAERGECVSYYIWYNTARECLFIGDGYESFYYSNDCDNIYYSFVEVYKEDKLTIKELKRLVFDINRKKLLRMVTEENKKIKEC